jgi:ribosomal-protein-alanine N-acetyltransferase
LTATADLGRRFIARAGRADLNALTALENRGQPHPWTPAGLEAELAAASPGGVVVVRDLAAGVVAYCAFRLVTDELHVHNLVVDPGFRRQGMARALLRVVLGLGRRAGARSAELDVRARNQAAIGLYAAEGFVTSGRRRGYYESPGDDALLMRLDLGQRDC